MVAGRMGEIIQTLYWKENGPTGGTMSQDDFRLHGQVMQN